MTHHKEAASQKPNSMSNSLGRRSFIKLIAGMAVVSACSRKGTLLQYKGASTLLPLMAEATRAFETEHPGVRFAITGGGSTGGILAAASGQADIGGVARALTTREQALVQPRRIALDGIAIVAERSVPLSDLTDAQLRELFTTGQMEGIESISVIGKNPAHGTHPAFAEALDLGGSALFATAEAGSNGEVLAFIRATKGIGYVSMADAHAAIAAGEPLKILSVNGVAPSLDTIADTSYPLVRDLFLVLPRPGTKVGLKPDPMAAAFLSFLTGPKGSALIEAAGFVPV